MYTPKIFKNANDDEIKNFIKQNGFGILVSTVEKRPWATHVPMLLSQDGKTLSGHLSRGNRQWKDFEDQEEILAIFNGPHSYISSSWYNHENVPTWNYIAVHVYGTIKIVEGEVLYQSLKHLVDKYEAHSAKPVSIEKMSTDYVQREMKGIVGFEILITSIEATEKLSQNRDKENYHNIIDELEKTNNPQSVEIAALMKKNESNIK